MHIVCYSHLFPNAQEPVRGPFILRRNQYLQQLLDITVVAPLPLAPPLPLVPRWWRLSKVPAHELIENIRVYHPRYLKRPGLPFRRQHECMFASALRQISAIHQRHPVDLIESPWLYPDALVATRVGKVLGIPVVATALGSDINEYEEVPALRAHVCEAMQQAAAVVCVSQALADAGARLGVAKEKFAVIYNGVNAEQFQPQDKIALRKALGLPVDVPVVVFVGHHEFIKGMDTLREAWPLVQPSNGIKPQLVMIGSGPMRQQLMAELEPQGVRFIAEQPHGQIARWIAAADALLLPSYAEGVPNVLLEANACGVPVICTDVGGVAEIMADLQPDGMAANGVMVPARQAQALAEGIGRVLSTRFDPQRVRASALRFNWQDCARDYAALFARTIQAAIVDASPVASQGGAA